MNANTKMLLDLLFSAKPDEVEQLLELCDEETKRLYTEISARAHVSQMLEDLQAVCKQLHEIEVAEHPDITDRWGRTWTWWEGDLYKHDDTLCFPLHFITSTEHPVGLPSAKLADNPGYVDLCSTCTQQWPVAARERLASLIPASAAANEGNWALYFDIVNGIERVDESKARE